MVGRGVFSCTKAQPDNETACVPRSACQPRALHDDNKLELRVMTISRSENMRRIRGKNTHPEMVVRALLRTLGHPGYRLHRGDLPGRPDIAYVGRRKAIVINGCFWHGHDCKKGRRKPKTNLDYWIPKIKRNQDRDLINQAALVELGWSYLVVWECELQDLEKLSKRLNEFLT